MNPNNPPIDVELQLVRTRNRRDAPPAEQAVVAIFDGSDGLPPVDIEFSAFKRSGADSMLQTLKLTNNYVDPLCYPLLFPYAEKGWRPDLTHVNPRPGARRTRMTLLDFYAYRLSVRTTEDYIFSTEKLFQQYVVDAYVKAESNRLLYLRQNQSSLKAETFRGLTDFVHGQEDQENPVGISLILLRSEKHGTTLLRCNVYGA